ncbi:hypothetical protein OH738_00510 [Streptomyces hirsutus]|uniref:hypothetical protein n=1 Tax=Streptomyces hirsutus TaxID=35620 RepID=UPI00386536F7|nr:hypothetical protein OH738_00510 [Streptomyces hirsutus]
MIDKTPTWQATTGWLALCAMVSSGGDKRFPAAVSGVVGDASFPGSHEGLDGPSSLGGSGRTLSSPSRRRNEGILYDHHRRLPGPL